MPVHCPINLPRLTTEEFAKIDYRVMAEAFQCHRELGRLADETIYQTHFAARLQSAGLNPTCEIPITVSYRTFNKTYFVDLVVDFTAVYELKAVRRFTDEHDAQLINYLILMNTSRGKLVNFRANSVQSRFVNAPFTNDERREFQIDNRRWKGADITRDWITDMLRDWGTGLELPLYHQAIVHLLGGEASVSHLLPLRNGNAELGNQRFHLMEDGIAFRLTAFTTPTRAYEDQIRKLLRLSSLKALHWINLAHHKVTFTTVS